MTRSRLTIWALGAVAVCGLQHAGAQDTATCDAKFATGAGGMSAYWTFNASGLPLVDDYAGFAGVNHGSTWIADGFIGGAMDFDGTSDYADISNAALNIPTWPHLTISVWFLNDGGGSWSGYNQKLLDKSAYFSDFHLCVGNNGAVQFVTSMPWITISASDRDYRDGQWHHAVVVKSGSYAELWTDGVFRGSNNQMASPNNGQPLLLGFTAHSDSNQRLHWSGAIDELAIFDRALSEPEVVDLHQTSAAGLNYCEQYIPDPCNDADFAWPMGKLNFFDVQAFLNCFAADDMRADLTDDSVCDYFDVQAFLLAYSAGCP